MKTTTNTIAMLLFAAPATFFAVDVVSAMDMDMDDSNNNDSINQIQKQFDFLSSACPTVLRDDCTILDSSDMSILRQGSNGWYAIVGNPRGPSGPDGMWASPHEATATCFDSEGMKWLQGIWTNTPPSNMERDAWLYMYNGDMGEDNIKPGVLNETDAVQVSLV